MKKDQLILKTSSSEGEQEANKADFDSISSDSDEELVMIIRDDGAKDGKNIDLQTSDDLMDRKLNHMDSENQARIWNIMTEKNLIGESLHDLRPAEVPYEHSFKLTTSFPLY
jgi:hypothetical protein